MSKRSSSITCELCGLPICIVESDVAVAVMYTRQAQNGKRNWDDVAKAWGRVAKSSAEHISVVKKGKLGNNLAFPK